MEPRHRSSLAYSWSPAGRLDFDTLGTLFRSPLSPVPGVFRTHTETVPRQGVGNHSGNAPNPYRRKLSKQG